MMDDKEKGFVYEMKVYGQIRCDRPGLGMGDGICAHHDCNEKALEVGLCSKHAKEYGLDDGT